MLKNKLNSGITRGFQNFRYSLAYIDALPQLTLLGALIGIITGLIIVCFRFLIDAPLGLFLENGSDDFESLANYQRLLLILGGTVSLGVVLLFLDKQRRDVGVAHVLDRLHNYQGSMPAMNWLWQFIAGVICMLSGQSVGREGPVVHMGAGTASQLAQWMGIPHNAMPTVIACGVAAAISASFDTPLAGVIFAMEVIILEYSIVGFVPLIMASVMGTVVSRAVLGETLHFEVNIERLGNLTELVFLIPLALLISLCAAIYIKLNTLALRLQHINIFLRLQIAGCLTIAAAFFVPQIMGLGYDTIDLAMGNEIAFYILVSIALTKLIVTPLVIGLGIPGGLIGPLLIIGACVGGASAMSLQHFFPSVSVEISIYILIGMVAMMAATLNAPLAALVAVLELSHSSNIIFPAMLVIVIACVVTRHLFRLNSIFIEQLNHTGRSLDFRQAKQGLKKVGVHSLMHRSFLVCSQYCNYAEARKLVEQQAKCLIFQVVDKSYLLPAADLASYLDAPPIEIINFDHDINLMEIPARREVIVNIHERASLLEAHELLESEGLQTLYVVRRGVPSPRNALGILTMDNIESYYQ